MIRLLKNIDLNKRIKKDFPENLYNPCLKNSNLYDLMVCYMSPNVFKEIYDGMQHFVKKEGCCFRMLISDDITNPELLMDAENKANTKQNYKFPIDAIESLKSNDDLKNYIAWLLSDKILQIKIVIRKDGELFHTKEGVFVDVEGNMVNHNGSQNFTTRGMTKNDETVTLTKSWKGDPENVFEDFTADFDKLWNMSLDGDNEYRVFSLSDLTDEGLKWLLRKKGTRPYNYNEEMQTSFLKEHDRELSDLPSEQELISPHIPDVVEKRNYQQKALKELKDNNYRGLLEMATGSGKTMTAIMSAYELYNKLKDLNRKLIIIITCQDIYMCKQWIDDLEWCGFHTFEYSSESDHKNASSRKDAFDKKIDDILLYDTKINNCLAIVSTKTSAAKEGFITDHTLDIIDDNDCDILMISDEAHHDGAVSWSKSLNDRYKYRIALTATPKRLRDEDGDQIIAQYFSGAHFVYDLKEAITGEVYGQPCLCPYRYMPKLCYVDIGDLVLLSEGGSVKEADCEDLSSRTLEIFRRLEEDLGSLENYKYTIIYAAPSATIDGNKEKMRDDIKKPIETVIKNIISKKGLIKYANIDSETPYEEREKSIESFKKGGHEIIIAIKCLDQGINIPPIQRAFILYSTSNPREYIQRRGRILRRSPGKESAEIYDYVMIRKTSINCGEDTPSTEKNKIKKEVERELNKIKEYSRYATNKDDSDDIINELEKILAKLEVSTY
ncbi:DEAD/DEAH box helicase family protein [bacterium]|jgi:superfamily II DNA or RNA helicase|nr:DEAD/DEAH box helicase family protein [bacterium]